MPAVAILAGALAAAGEPTLDAPDPASAEAADAPAAAPPDWLGLKLSARAGGWTHDRQLNGEEVVPMAGLRARIAPRIGAVDAFAEGYVQTDRVDGTHADLVEGWVRLSIGAAELRAGRQIVVWGRADRLNPTDNIAGRDYTLLTASDDEQRQGPAMVQARWGRDAWTVDLYWLPEFRPNVYPLTARPAGVAVLPDERRRKRAQFAARVDHSGGAFDWSLSWFRGIDRNRDVTRRAAPAGFLAAVQQTYPDITVWGADAAGTLGAVGWRIEAAYSVLGGPDTPFRKNDNLWIVAGGDVTFGGGWNVNLQYSVRRIFDYRDPRRLADPVTRQIASVSAAVSNQLDRTQNGVTARLARRFANDTVDAEISAAHNFETGDTAIRPKVTQAIRDGLRLTVGADLFRGPALSSFGRVRDLSSGYLQLTAGF